MSTWILIALSSVVVMCLLAVIIDSLIKERKDNGKI